VKFFVFLADPPWQYDHSYSENRVIENQYPNIPGLLSSHYILYSNIITIHTNILVINFIE